MVGPASPARLGQYASPRLCTVNCCESPPVGRAPPIRHRQSLHADGLPVAAHHRIRRRRAAPGFNRRWDGYRDPVPGSGVAARVALGQDALPDDFLVLGRHRHPVRHLGHGAAAAAANFVEGGRADRDTGGVGTYRSPDRTYRSPDRTYRSPDRTFGPGLSVLVRHRACPSRRGPVVPWSRYSSRKFRPHPGRLPRRARCCLRAAAAGSGKARGW